MSRVSAQIVSLDAYRAEPLDDRVRVRSSNTAAEAGSTSISPAGYASTVLPEGSAAKEPSFEDLYGTDIDASSPTIKIRQLLLENATRIAGGLYADEIVKDDAVSLLKVDIAQLFSYSTAGRGLQMVLVALHHSLRNRKGQPLSVDEYYHLNSLLSLLAEAPHLGVEKALDWIDDLETVGFDTDPQEAGLIYEVFND